MPNKKPKVMRVDNPDVAKDKRKKRYYDNQKKKYIKRKNEES